MASAPYHSSRPGAIVFTRPGFRTVLPHNPTATDDDQDFVATQRQTLDGMLSQLWFSDLNQFVVSGITGAEGPDPWYTFKRNFHGKIASYYNSLTGVSMSVLVRRVRIQGDGRSPYTYSYTIQLQEAGSS